MDTFPTPDPTNPKHAAGLEQLLDRYGGNLNVNIPFTAARHWQAASKGEPGNIDILVSTVGNGIEAIANTLNLENGRQVIHSWFTDEGMGGDFCFIYDVNISPEKSEVLVLGPIPRTEFLTFFPDLAAKERN